MSMYLAQLETLAIIAFLLWRVETLETLDAKETVLPEDISADTQTEGSSTNSLSVSMFNKIQDLLDIHCETGQLYLQHDLTLQQLGRHHVQPHAQSGGIRHAPGTRECQYGIWQEAWL